MKKNGFRRCFWMHTTISMTPIEDPKIILAQHSLISAKCEDDGDPPPPRRKKTTVNLSLNGLLSMTDPTMAPVKCTKTWSRNLQLPHKNHHYHHHPQHDSNRINTSGSCYRFRKMRAREPRYERECWRRRGIFVSWSMPTGRRILVRDSKPWPVDGSN